MKAPFQIVRIVNKFENIQDPELVGYLIMEWNDIDKLSFDEIIAKLEERGM